MRVGALVALLLGAGCDKSSDLEVRFTGEGVVGDVELRVYEGRVACPTLEGPFDDPGFDPSLIPVEGLVAAAPRFERGSPVSGLEGQEHTLLAWSDTSGCVTQTLGCQTLTLAAPREIVIPMRRVDSVAFCGGACDALPRCLDPPDEPDGGPVCADGCCGPDATGGCVGDFGDGQCFGDTCVPFTCVPGADQCVQERSADPGVCCDLRCIDPSAACDSVCEPPFFDASDGEPEGCDYLATLRPVDGGAPPVATRYATLVFARLDRSARWQADGGAAWMSGDTSPRPDVRFTIGPPPLEVRLCADGGADCVGDPNQLEVAVGAVRLSEAPALDTPTFGWGTDLYVWSSRAAGRDELTALFSANGASVRVLDDAPERMSLWTIEGDRLRRLMASAEDLLQACTPGDPRPCDTTGPIPSR